MSNTKKPNFLRLAGTKSKYGPYLLPDDSVLWELRSADGKYFGDVSYDAYKAVENGTLDSYTPKTDEERRIITEFRQHPGIALKIDGAKAPWRSDFGKISYDGYHALLSGKEGEFTPYTDSEKKAITDFKNYVERQTGPRSSVVIKTPSGTEDYVTRATANAIARGPLISPNLRSSIGVDRDYVSNYYSQAKKIEDEEKAKERQKRVDSNPTYKRYDIDPAEFTESDLDEWAKEHNFEKKFLPSDAEASYAGKYDLGYVYVPKREGGFWGIGSKKLTTKQDEEDLDVLFKLVNDRIRQEGIDTDKYVAEQAWLTTKGIGRSFLNTIDDAYMREQEEFRRMTSSMKNIDPYFASDKIKYHDEQISTTTKAIKDRTTKQTVEGSKLDTKYSHLSEDTRTVGKVIGGSVQVVPLVLTSAINPALGTAVFATQVYGGSLGQALVEGASIKDARTYAGAETTKEILIEKLFGGLPFTKSVSKKFLNPVVNKIFSNPFAREIVKKGADILGEGFEEAASEFISPYIKRAIYDKNAPNATKEELGFAFFSGVVPSMLLNVPVTINTVKAYGGLEEKINQYNKWIDVLPETVRPEYLDVKKTTIDDYNSAVDNMIVASSKHHIQAEKEATEAAVKYFNSEIEKLQKLNLDNAENQELITGFSRHINANNDYVNDLEHQLKELDLIERGKDDGTLIQKYKSESVALKELNPTHIDIAVGANNEKGFVNVTKLSDNTYAVKTVDGNTLYKSDVQFSDRYVELEEANISKKHLEKFLGSDIIKTDDAKSSSTIESKEDDIDGVSEVELSLPQKVNEQVLKTLQSSDISKGEARIPVENVINLVKYRTEIISEKYRLKPENLYDANLETVSSKDGIMITENVKMQYADALVQSIRPNTNLYLELTEISDDVGQFIYDTYKQGAKVQISPKIDNLIKRYEDILGDVSKTAVDMHRIIYGDVSNNVEGANSTKFVLTGEGTVPKMRVEPSQKDVDDVVSAINDTLKQNSLQSLSGYMKKGGNMSDFDELGRLLINGYLESGNIGDIGKYLQDGGLTVINAIKRVGGNDYESERIAQGRAFRDTSDVERAVSERAQEHSEGISRETGDAQGPVPEGTIRKQIDDIVYNEVQREFYTKGMVALENLNKDKYSVDTIYFSGTAIDSVGTRLNGFYFEGVLYLQIDSAHSLKSIRDHEVTHHFGKSKAYENFRKAVKAKMSVEKFNEWKAEVRLAYRDLVTDYLAKKFKKSGRTLTNEQLQELMDNYLEEEMMANLNAETVNFAKEYAKEIADFRNGIEMTTDNSNTKVSSESKAENKPGEYVRQIDAGGDVKYSFSEREEGMLYTLDDLKGNAGILYNNGKTIRIPDTDMGVLLHTYKTEEHYSNRTEGIIDCISCSGRGDTKHYFYVFYKGEDGRVAPIFRLDYSYLNNYIDEVRKISEELGYDRNEFVNGNERIRGQFTKVKSVGGNGSFDADASTRGRTETETSSLSNDLRGRSSGEVRDQSQYSERDSFGLSDEQHKRNGDRDSNGRLSKLPDSENASDKVDNSDVPRRSIVGIKSLTADKEAYNKAVEMDKQGYDIEELWKETGWSKGVDGHFKTELDDSKYEFTMPSTAKENLYVKDFVKHDELFAAYPQIKDIPVLYDENMDDDGEASYLPNIGEHIAGVGDLGIIRINPQKSIYELKKSMLHELQHVIQFIEGFEQGASESYWRQRIKEGYDIGNIDDYLQLNVSPAHQLYEDTAGEREARDVVDRMNFTLEQRKNTFPYSMDDSEGVVFADGSSVAAFKKETKQNGVMWTIQQGILDKKEVAAFYSKVSELRNNKYRTFRQSSDGDYIFSVDNKLIYSDADYEYPKIKTVITFETDDENLIDYARECFYEGETYGRRIEDTKKIAEIMLGEGTIKRANYNPNGTDERVSNYSRESESGTTADSRSGEDVRRSISTDTQDRIEKIAKEEVFHEELTELARKNKQEFISRIRHNEQLQKRLDNAQRQMRLTKVPLADRAKVEKFIKSIVTNMHSVINPRDIHAEVLSIYDEYIAAVKKAGNVPESVQSATDNMVKRFTDVAADIIDNAQDVAVDEDFARLKGWLKNTDIKFPDDAKAEAHFAEFRKKHFGSISLTNDGLPIDMAYNELCEVFPYIFNKSVTAPADQLNAIADALQALKPETYNPHAEYIEDAIEHVVSLFVLEADGISVTKDTRADRLVKKAESQKATALEKQKEAFKRQYDRHKEKSDEQINKLKEQLKAHSYTQYWERRLSSEEKSAAIKTVRQRQKISMAKAHIRKMVSELKHGLDTTEKSGGIPKELVKAIAEVCSVIDFHTDRTTPEGDVTKASLKLDALQVQYDNLKNNTDYDIQSEWHEEISEYIRQLNDTVRNKCVVDLNLMELSALEDILVQIRHTISNAKKQIGIDSALENREIGMKICEDLNGKEDFIAPTKKMLVKRLGTNVFAANTLSPMRVAEMISGYNRDGEFYKLFRQLNDGVHKGDMFKMDATKPFNVLMEGPGNQALMYDFLIQLHDTGIKDTKGNIVMLSKNMICEVIMLWERKQGREHLGTGGMTIPNIKLFNTGKTQEAYTEGAVRTVAITERDITRLRSMLDSYDKAWIEEARILFNEKSQKAINETSLQLVGRTIANAKNYIPIHTDTKFVRTDIEGLKVDATLEGAGSLKAVVENAKQPILITGISYSTSEHIDFVAKYHGLAIPIRNFNKVYNVTFADENDTTQSVKDTIGHKWGAKIQKGVIEQTLKDLQTTRNRERDVFNKVMGTIQSNWVGATLNSNPSVALKQLTSYVTASSVLGSTPLVKALPYFSNTKATVEEIDRYTGIHFKRRLGYSTQELGDRANRKTGQGLANKARKAMSQSQITAWVNHLPKGFFPTNWMQSVDCRVAAVLWEASKYYVSDTLGIAKESENYWKEVTRIYECTIEETQSNYDILHKPEVLKSTSEMTRLISMFQNDALQGSGLLWTAFNDWNTKHHSYKSDSTAENKKDLEMAQERFKKVAFAQISSALTLATLTLVARALLRKVKPYKDEEKNEVNAGSISKQVGMDTLENLFTNAIPVLGNLLVSAKDTFVYGYDFASVPTFDTVQNLIDSISGVYDVIDKWDITAGEDKWNKVRGALNELAISAATSFGIPAQNVINMFNGVKGYVGDIKEGDFFHDINEIIATNRRVFSYADLASAVATGDRKKEQKILEYYKNIGVEVQKSSLTTQLKPAYVKCFVDEPEKAYAIRKSLVLRYDYSDDVFDEWIYDDYVNALLSDKEEYAAELENATKHHGISLKYEDIRSSLGKAYRDVYANNPEEATKVRNLLSKKYCNADFDKWESDVNIKKSKDAAKSETDKEKYE